MAIPFAKDLVTVRRGSLGLDVDGYEDTPDTFADIQQRVRAVINLPSANATLTGGDRITYETTMICDPCEIQQEDVVLAYNREYVVLWVQPSGGALGFDHLNVGLRLVTGAAAI